MDSKRLVRFLRVFTAIQRRSGTYTASVRLERASFRKHFPPLSDNSGSNSTALVYTLAGHLAASRLASDAANKPLAFFKADKTL
jgi:hypothetical protein